MGLFGQFILALWLVLAVVWIISARNMKPGVGTKLRWRREAGLRLVLAALVFAVLRLFGPTHVWRHTMVSNTIAGSLGVPLCASGVGLALVARHHLGRNWGLPMTRKRDPELVTTGPYAVIRHPIYTGILLAILGSAVGQNLVWVAAFIAAVPYFIHSARREEAFMCSRFPGRYNTYKKRTRMFLPYIL